MVFFEQLLYLSFEFRKLKEDLDILEAEAEEIEDKLTDETLKPYQIKKLQAELNKKKIDIQEKSFGVQHHIVQARERTREIEIWSRIKAELNDGSFDIDDKNTNQLLSYARRYCQENWNAIYMNKGGGGDISSFNNITAQYRSFVGQCLSKGLANELLSTFGGVGHPIFDMVVRDFNLQVQQTPPTTSWGRPTV